jgi:hypothetical protein
MIIRQRWLFIILLIAVTSSFVSITSFATELEVNGFAGGYARKSLTKRGEPNETIDRSLDSSAVDFSENMKAGFNVRADFDKKWSFLGQAVAYGRQGERVSQNFSYRWALMFDWMYLSYTANKYAEIKVGRQLLPGLLVAEYVDVGYTYPWYKPPPHVYTILPFKSFEGTSINLKKTFRRGRALDIKLYAGGSRPTHEDLDEYFVTKIDNLYGGLVALSGVGWTLQTSLFQYTQVIDQQFVWPPSADAQTISSVKEIDGRTIGFKYDNKLVLYAEYAKICCSSIAPTTVSAINPLNYQEGYYGTLGVRIGNWLPHYTYAKTDWEFYYLPGKLESHSFAVNYRMNPNVVLKIDYTMHDTEDGKVILYEEGEAQTVTIGMDAIF